LFDTDGSFMSRRTAIRLSVLGGLALPAAGAAPPRPTRQVAEMRRRPVPFTGELLPVVGLGTNRYGGEAPDPDSPLCGVIAELVEQGGSVVDTARNYGRAEEVIGACLPERERYFLATKLGRYDRPPSSWTERAARADLELAFVRLGTDSIDLMMAHDFSGPDELLPPMRELKGAGRLRYVGMSTSSDGHYEALLERIRTERLDFIEVDYSLDNRNAAQRVLPAAADAGISVIVNVPLGGRSGLLSTLLARPLPEWAAELGARSWPQALLKYVLAHPAVTVVIPGTTRVEHLVDNCAAGRGPLPDPGLRRQMEAYVDAL
jgi:aryl-alcohol dehydrogenase-like predicted oxidoreductase